MCKSPKVDTSARDAQQAEAERARLEQEQRETRIKWGERDIRNIFGGGRYRTSLTKEVVPSYGPAIQRVPGGATTVAVENRGPETRQDVDSGGVDGTTQQTKRWQVGDNLFGTRSEAKQYRQGLRGEKEVWEKTFDRSEGIAPYLEQREAALRGFFTPQLEEQFEDAGDDLTNALARAGLLRSSVANERRADLSDMFKRNAAEIESDIAEDISQTRSRFADEEASLIASLRASGNRDASVASALRGFERLTNDAPKLSTLASLFEGAAAGIGAARTGYDNGVLSREVKTLAPRLSRGSAGRTVGG